MDVGFIGFGIMGRPMAQIYRKAVTRCICTMSARRPKT